MISRRSLLAAPLVLAASRVRAERPYDVALVLATDVSSSILGHDYEIQKQGIVAGLTDRNMELLLAQGRRFLFSYMEWSGRDAQAVSGWHPIETFDDALAFAGVVHGWERSSREGETAIAHALRASHYALAEVKGQAIKRVVDLSFDGHDNAPPNAGGGAGAVRLTADVLAAEDIIVNGLIIPEAGGEDLETYFRDRIAGPRSFSVTVPRPDAFAAMFLRKLIEEVS